MHEQYRPAWAQIAAIGGEWFLSGNILDTPPKPDEEYVVKYPASWEISRDEGWFFYEPPSARVDGWEASPEKSDECRFVWGRILADSVEGDYCFLRISTIRIVDFEELVALPVSQPEGELFCKFVQEVVENADEYASYAYSGYSVIIAHAGQGAYCTALVYRVSDNQRFLLLQSDESSGGNFYFAGNRLLSERENIFLTALEEKAGVLREKD